MVGVPAIDIDSLTDTDLLHLAKGSGETAQAAAPSGAPSGPIDIDKMTDAQLKAFAGQGHQTPMGTGEAAGRLFYKHLTFGTEPGADRAKTEQAEREHPFLNVGTGAGAMLAQTAALGPLAVAGKGVQGAGMLARGARGAGKALEYTMLPNAEARTALTTGRTAAKLTGNYSALETAGHDLTDPNKTLSDTAKDVGIAYGAGTALGFPLGVGAHGLSRAVGAGANRLFPALKEVGEAARAPGTQGARDIMDVAALDKYKPADFEALKTALADPAQAHRYEGLNLVEALEARRLQEMPHTGELKPEQRYSPNLRAAEQDAAQTQGEGRHEAVTKYGTRKNEMSSKIQAEIDRLFGDPEAAALQRQFGAPPEAVTDAERLPHLINRHLGSGNAVADAEALAGQQAALSKRYNRLRSKPLQQVDLGQGLQRIPVFQKAMDYAAQNDMIRMAEAGTDTAWGKNIAPWSKGDLGQTVLTMSPENILDIHHSLVMSAKPRIGADPQEAMMASRAKNVFSKWVDDQFKGHKELRNDYEAFKRSMEAQEQASKLPVNSGGTDHPAMQFLNQAQQDHAASVKRLETVVGAYERAFQKFQNGQRKTAPTEAAVRNATAARDTRANVIDTFRKRWGDNVTEQLRQSDNPQALLDKMLTPTGQSRILAVAGPEEGPKLLNSLLTMQARNEGKSFGLVAGGNDTGAEQFFDRMVRQKQIEPVDAFIRAWGDKHKEILGAKGDAGVAAYVRSALTEEGKRRILKILGPEKGREMIEALYNKLQQTGLSQTLFGGPDTAYKLARNQKKDALMDAVYNLAPWHFHPFEALKNVRELGSAAYKQRRADQANRLFAQQGPEDVSRVIDSVLANERLRGAAHPYVRNPAVRLTGPAGAEAQQMLEEAYGQTKRRP